MNGFYRAGIFAVALSVAGCTGDRALDGYGSVSNTSNNAAITRLTKEQEDRLWGIEEKVLSMIRPLYIGECFFDSNLKVEKLKKIKALKRKPAGTYNDDTGERKIDIDYFEKESDFDVAGVDFHEASHRADIGCNLIDREKFIAIYSSDDMKNYRLRKSIENILEEDYNSEHADLWAERVAYAAQLWAFGGHKIPDDMKKLFENVFDPEMIKTMKNRLNQIRVTNLKGHNLKESKQPVVGNHTGTGVW